MPEHPHAGADAPRELPAIPGTLDELLTDIRLRFDPEDAEQFLQALKAAGAAMGEREKADMLGSLVEASDRATEAMMIAYGIASRYFSETGLLKSLAYLTGIALDAEPVRSRGELYRAKPKQAEPEGSAKSRHKFWHPPKPLHAESILLQHNFPLIHRQVEQLLRPQTVLPTTRLEQENGQVLPSIPNTLESILADSRSTRWNKRDASIFARALLDATLDMAQEESARSIDEHREPEGRSLQAMLTAYAVALRYYALPGLRETLQHVTGVSISPAQLFLPGRNDLPLRSTHAELRGKLTKVLEMPRASTDGRTDAEEW